MASSSAKQALVLIRTCSRAMLVDIQRIVAWQTATFELGRRLDGVWIAIHAESAVFRQCTWVGISKQALVEVAAFPDAISSPSLGLFAEAVIAARRSSVDSALGVAVAEMIRIAWAGLLFLLIRGRVDKLSPLENSLLLVSQRKGLGFTKEVLLNRKETR